MLKMLRVICLSVVLAVLFLPSMNECWEIKVQPEILDIGDRNVQLHCFSSRQTQSSITQVIRLRLRKLSDNNNWTDLASIRGDGSITSLSEANATVTGQLGRTNAANSFLNVTWPEINDEVFGKFLCDAVGYTQTQELETEHSETLEVNVKGLSGDSLRLYELIHESQRKSDLIIAKLWSDVSSKLNELDSRISNLTNSNASQTCTVHGNDTDSIMWPEGNFTLLKPDTGCPLDSRGWDRGYLKMNEGNAYRYNKFIRPLHVAQPHRSSGYVYQYYCAIRGSYERMTGWPSGSYCIHSASRSFSCPGGFNLTRLWIDYKDDYFGNHGSGPVPSTSVGVAGLSVNFCCRHDASPSTAIDLPVSKPFYLFRHGGTCQQVKGMHVTQDVFMLDTETESGGDHWYSGYPAAYTPDVSFKPIKEELCYYTKMAD